VNFEYSKQGSVKALQWILVTGLLVDKLLNHHSVLHCATYAQM